MFYQYQNDSFWGVNQTWVQKFVERFFTIVTEGKTGHFLPYTKNIKQNQLSGQTGVALEEKLHSVVIAWWPGLQMDICCAWTLTLVWDIFI